MRKILIPTDFSSNSMNAANYAVNLFKYEVSEFFFMHAYQDEIYANEDLLSHESLETVVARIKRNVEEELQNMVASIDAKTSNPRHKYHIIASKSLLVDAADSIVDDENIDVIVMGTKGKTNSEKVTFGSHTLQVLKYVQCPVLAIPENYKFRQPKYILFPTNYMIPYKRRELKLLCELAHPFRAKIDVLYISQTSKLSLRQEDNKTFIKEELCKNSINFKVKNSKSIVNAIYKYIEENQIDMLVMVNTRHSFLESMLYQTTIDKLSLNLDIPFLALQNIRRK